MLVCCPSQKLHPRCRCEVGEGADRFANTSKERRSRRSVIKVEEEKLSGTSYALGRVKTDTIYDTTSLTGPVRPKNSIRGAVVKLGKGRIGW